MSNRDGSPAAKTYALLRGAKTHRSRSGTHSCTSDSRDAHGQCTRPNYDDRVAYNSFHPPWTHALRKPSLPSNV